MNRILMEFISTRIVQCNVSVAMNIISSVSVV